MKERSLRTSVIGSYPFPGWLEFASLNLDKFGPADLAELQEDAVVCAVHDQVAAAVEACGPGPYTLSGRLGPDERYRDRWALTEALLPLVRAELEALVRAGCREICVDEPSMSCYAHREDPRRFVEIFNRTVESV